MSTQRDVQTVHPDGTPVAELPEGVVIRRGVTHVDDRGSVHELHDVRWGVHPGPVVFSYVFTLRPGKAKGWGVHREHEDRYAIVFGELELVLYDERADSATYGLEARLRLSEFDRCQLNIPAGVWHAERNGSTDVVVVNFPTIVYDHGNPDKYRLPLDTDELPVDLGPGWDGW